MGTHVPPEVLCSILEFLEPLQIYKSELLLVNREFYQIIHSSTLCLELYRQNYSEFDAEQHIENQPSFWEEKLLKCMKFHLGTPQEEIRHLAIEKGWETFIEKNSEGVGRDVLMCDMFHAVKTKQLEVVWTLLQLWRKRGINIESRQHGYTALHSACYYKSLPIIKLLCDMGADVLAREVRYGQLPVHISCRCDDLESVKYFIEEQHVNPQSLDLDMWSLRDLAEGRESILTYLNQLGV
ncbi:hypothetical protein AKO1_001607 [Acrasis kona]|uniref:F-box domain-containing protein n=1 Tax=Acrasis kona TaxID=1008807 RepID=A0AAW2ZA21_9EUKA